MNHWDCDEPGCGRFVVGCGGGVGLRAIGWYFRRGPVTFCPEHRPDKERADGCALCVADLDASHYQRVLEPSDLLPVVALEHFRSHREKEQTEPAYDDDYRGEMCREPSLADAALNVLREKLIETVTESIRDAMP